MKTKINLFAIFFFASLLMASCVSEASLSADNTIQSFSITKENITKEFPIEGNSINGIVESTFELENISLAISIPKGANINPDPATIKSISGPLTFVVTAENGDVKTYLADIRREPSTDNFILELNVKTPNLVLSADINNERGLVTKRIPEINDLKNLDVELKFSKHATITPDPKTIKDYSEPVNFTVKSESGAEKVYQVKLEYMNNYISRSCSESNASKWFGGDNRTNAPDILPFDRNIGTGQTVIVDKNLVPSTFRIHLQEGFVYYEGRQKYNKPVTLKLIVKDANRNILATTTTEVSESFNGGFIPFDLQALNLYLEANKKYSFYWYLVDGEKLGIYAASSANTKAGDGFCFTSGYSGESRISKNNSLEDANVWFDHDWHFNIELVGKE
ncbi:DUF5018 domain-containing protein [Flavobacterium sharifuzzamanii]|uniref:DUF5018 domain-containing protein n=1 Tax=Flavobacterium sharifuzzamanii TaxID=2211133 RepID=UPI000DAC4274|nr:DUF5018 domain-containing protein [Flavobacterium sharifuzzamanii]KAF2080319.1 DUF5018 domain-containing protein [Flavobacterium sharifuzzamanii]